MSILGIALTREPPEQDHNEKKDTTAQSLSPVQVLKTKIFYLVSNILFSCIDNFNNYRFGFVSLP